MREILFRGKTFDIINGEKIEGKWVEGAVIYDEKYNKAKILEWRFYSDKQYGICSDTTYHNVIPETVGQYTGLTDKNGKKIFEGDIVKADDYIFVVKFGKCGGVANSENYGYMGYYFEAFSESTKLSAKYGLRDDICYFADLEVIGNIHDNPELLVGD